MRYLILLSAVLLAGCWHTPPKLPDPEVRMVDRIQYVIALPPEELLKMPVEPAPINVDTATQATFAQWLIDNEAYINALRNRLVEIARFLRDKQEKLDDKAREENIRALTEASKSQK